MGLSCLPFPFAPHPARRAPLRFTRADPPLRRAPLRLTRADPPFHSGQPSPLRRARLSPPGLPPRRGPHRAALAASAHPPFPTGAAAPPGAPSGSPRRFSAPAFPHRGCRPAGGPIGQPSPLRRAPFSAAFSPAGGFLFPGYVAIIKTDPTERSVSPCRF